MSLFGQTKRHSISKPGRRSPLPIFSADPEKRYGLSSPPPLGGGSGGSASWYSVFYVPIPRIPLLSRSSSSESLMNGTGKSFTSSHHIQQRYVRLYLPIPPRVAARLPRPTPLRLLILLVITLSVGVFLLGFRKRPDGRNTWSPPFVDPSTTVLMPEELAMIWEWEVLSGHYPSLSQGKFDRFRSAQSISLIADNGQLPKRSPSPRQYATPLYQKPFSRSLIRRPLPPTVNLSVSAPNGDTSAHGIR